MFFDNSLQRPHLWWRRLKLFSAAIDTFDCEVMNGEWLADDGNGNGNGMAEPMHESANRNTSISGRVHITSSLLSHRRTRNYIFFMIYATRGRSVKSTNLDRLIASRCAKINWRCVRFRGHFRIREMLQIASAGIV